MEVFPPSSANINFTVAKNTSFSDALQFDDENDLSWSFTNKTFRMGVKGNYEQSPEIVAFTSAAAQIIVVDAIKRVLYFNVLPATMTAALVPGTYRYDLVMTDTDTAVRSQIAHGAFNFVDAITEG